MKVAVSPHVALKPAQPDALDGWLDMIYIKVAPKAVPERKYTQKIKNRTATSIILK